jgi:hypothetical protein
MYEKNEKLYMHKIFLPSFQYELIILIPEPKTLDEEKERR